MIESMDGRHLSSMYVPFCSEDALQAGAHSSKILPNKVRFLETFRMCEYVRYGRKIRRNETISTKESFVGVGVAILGLPVKQETCVLLVVHLPQVSKQERGRGRGAECSER